MVINGQQQVLGLDLGVGFPHNRHIRSTIHLFRRVWHLCIPMIGSIVGHPSSYRIQRWSSLGRVGERLCIWRSLPSRVPWRYRSLLCWLGYIRVQDQRLVGYRQKLRRLKRRE